METFLAKIERRRAYAIIRSVEHRIHMSELFIYFWPEVASFKARFHRVPNSNAWNKPVIRCNFCYQMQFIVLFLRRCNAIGLELTKCAMETNEAGNYERTRNKTHLISIFISFFFFRKIANEKIPNPSYFLYGGTYDNETQRHRSVM